MIALLDTSQDLKTASLELGCKVEHLLTPLTRYLPQYPAERFAVDNGAFSGFDLAGFLSLLEREKRRRHLCRFVAVPDVVGSGRRTLELFDYWHPRLTNWPLALVAQDGLEDLPTPWERMSAVFIGGSTEWKMGRHAAAVIRAAQGMGKWVHVGRVNTPARFEYFEGLGVDSIDGTGLSRYTHMRTAIYEAYMQPTLFSSGVAA